jgi:hypothetical protein
MVHFRVITIDLFLSSKTRREVNGDFQVDLQDQECFR